MAERHAHLRLRYRPSADVLSGEVDLAQLGPTESTVESPDADTSVVWSRPTGGEHAGQEYLTSFHLVHAQARPRALPDLPADVEPIARQLMGSAELDPDLSPVERIRAFFDTSADLPLSAFGRSPQPVTVALSLAYAPSASTPRSDARALAAALRDLATRVAAAPELADALEELAVTIAHSGARPAPGTSSAPRKLVKGDLPMSRDERTALRRALKQLDDPAHWHDATAAVESIQLR